MMSSNKGFIGKYGISIVAMNAFLRSKGLAKGRGKIAVRIDKAFALYGKQRPSEIKLVDFCRQNKEFIKEKGAAFKSTWKVNTSVKVDGLDPNADDFLMSYQWRSLRMKVLKHYGAKCMCCGATPDDGVKMHVDHIKPRRHFPKLALDFDNLQVLCEVCNHGKGNWDETDWRPEPEVEEEVKSFLRSIARER